LLGDVGSGKTIVAAIAVKHVLQNNFNTALIAPTQILAKQHFQTLHQIFPDMKIALLTAKNRANALNKISNTKNLANQSTCYIGTHAVINKLSQIKPALVIYDEQHRFGVAQRSQTSQLSFQPHLLTMSATPIPRSLMLSIFAHLSLSVIDEMPQGRKPIKTWLVPEKKRLDAYRWLAKQLSLESNQTQPSTHTKTHNHNQVLIVCPFINPSEHEMFKDVASATEKYQQIKARFPNLVVQLLHSRQSQPEKDKIIQALFAQEIDILVTTPIVEVGLDLQRASIIIIESAQRYGLASLHQLRGRVGRAGQKGYCLLFANLKNAQTSQRLKIFSQTTNGMKLAEFDLKNRGAGDLFGSDQHGFDQLKFSNWTNLELISQARAIFKNLKDQPNLSWKPIIKFNYTSKLPLPN
jgi:ATP-dependent DNA helicase RecG